MKIDRRRLTGPGYERHTAIGERHGRSKLTDDTVRLMRHLYETEGWTIMRLARTSGLHHSTVHKIVRKATWRHI